MKQYAFALITILLLFINQWLLYVFPFAGLVSNAALLILFLLLAVYNIFNGYIEDILTLASVIPLINFCLFIIPNTLPKLLQLYAINILLIFFSLYFLQILPIPHHHFKLKKINIPLLLFIGLLGILLPFIFALFYEYKPVSSLPTALSFVFVIFSSITEVVYFQGLFQNALSSKTNHLFAAFVTAGLFALFHASANILYIPLYFILGFFTAGIYALVENLQITICFSFLVNFIFLLILYSPLWLALS